MNIIIGVSWFLVVLILGLARGQSEGDVRVISGSGVRNNEGNVEIYVNGKWSLIKDDSAFTFNVAMAVCRQAGFTGVTDRLFHYRVRIEANDPRRNEQRISLKGVSCKGDENALTECDGFKPSALAYDDVNKFPLAAVQCTDVRMVDTSNEGYSGRVEVYNRGVWYGICGDYWDEYNGMIACQMLFPGIDTTIAETYKVPYTSDMGDKVFPIITCVGDEYTYDDCGWIDEDLPCNTRGAVDCMAGGKKEMDLKDDLKIRTAQLLLDLLQAKK